MPQVSPALEIPPLPCNHPWTRSYQSSWNDRTALGPLYRRSCPVLTSPNPVTALYTSKTKRMQNRVTVFVSSALAHCTQTHDVVRVIGVTQLLSTCNSAPSSCRPSKASSITSSMTNLEKISEMKHPCQTPTVVLNELDSFPCSLTQL